MGVNISTLVNETIQVGYVDVLQASRTTCLSSCRANTENVSIIVSGNSTLGDITITQQCLSEASCNIKTELGTVAQQEFDSISFSEIDNTGVAGWLQTLAPGWRVNTTYNSTQQYLYNSTTQVINTSCVALSNVEVSNINVFVSDNSTVGNFTIEQQATARASCEVENVANAYSYQQASAESVAGIHFGNSLALVAVIALAVITTLLVVFLNLQGAKTKKEQEIETLKVKAATQAPVTQAQAAVYQATAQTQLDIIRKQYGLPPLAVAAAPTPVVAATPVAVVAQAPVSVPVAASIPINIA